MVANESWDEKRGRSRDNVGFVYFEAVFYLPEASALYSEATARRQPVRWVFAHVRVVQSASTTHNHSYHHAQLEQLEIGDREEDQVSHARAPAI